MPTLRAGMGRSLPGASQKKVELGEVSAERAHQVKLDMLKGSNKALTHLRGRFCRCFEKRDCPHERRIDRLQDLGQDSAPTFALKLGKTPEDFEDVRR